MITAILEETIQLGSIEFKSNMSVTMLGTDGEFKFSKASAGISVEMPDARKFTSKWAYTLVFTNIL